VDRLNATANEVFWNGTELFPWVLVPPQATLASTFGRNNPDTLNVTWPDEIRR
jgi:hypothetical protein